jgi:hypothetical protein
MKNDRKTSLLLGPLILGSLLVAVTSRRNRMPSHAEVKSDHSAHPTPILTATPTTTDSQTVHEIPDTQWWKGLPEAAGLVVAFGLLILSAWQLRTASHALRKASDAMQSIMATLSHQLEMSQRPWVSINAIIVSPLTFNSEGAAQVTLKFSIRNVGSTPAKGLSIEPKMFVASLGEQDPVMERSMVCEKNRTRGIETDGTLFPTLELTKSVTLQADAKEIIKESNRTGSFAPALVVCASYKSTFDDRSRYTTGVIYYLRRIDPAHPGTYFRMKNGIDIPRELLALNYDPIGEAVAN